MNILVERDVNTLIFECALRRNHKACSILEFYVAQARIHSRLETAFGLEVRPPVLGPDPAPEKSKIVKWLMDGDPDGSPARIYPTADFTSDPKRLRLGLESAVQLRATILEVVSALEGDIKELELKLDKIEQLKV
jgi:hypothetical protein